MSAEVAAVVVRWRGGDEVEQCLSSLLARSGRRLSEVVLVDSGSGDGGAERLAAAYPEVQVLALEENRGFAFAADRGVAATGAALVLLLNPDAQVCEGAVDTLAAFLDRDGDIAGAVPLLEGADGASQHRWQLRRLPGPLRLALGVAGAPQFRSSPPSVPAPVTQPAAAAWLVRRQVWQALDGLDQDFAPAWWEDVDFCRRLDGRLGDPDLGAEWGFWVVPEARVRHLGGSSVGQLGDEAFLAAFYRNLLRYARRHHPYLYPLVAVGLRSSLAGRAIMRPRRRAAYRAALRAVGA